MGACTSSPSTKDTGPSTKQTPYSAPLTRLDPTPLPASTSGSRPISAGAASPSTTANGGSTFAQGLGAALAEPPGSAVVANGTGGPGNKDRSNLIDRQIDDDSKKFRKECKILLLGTSYFWGKGKS
jgi:guanine nucleotide-binding protein G(i) subunit alpha